MKVIIRQEKPGDYDQVEHVIRMAFIAVPASDQTEHYLVKRMRNAPAFIPELSLVAEIHGQIVGHILFTRIKIKNEEHLFCSLALAPVSVLPEFQNKGIGGSLIETGHRMAKKLGHTSVVLLGHANYYPRFGYKLASHYKIKIPFEAPDENCMVVELIPGGLKNVLGTVIYPDEFYG